MQEPELPVRVEGVQPAEEKSHGFTLREYIRVAVIAFLLVVLIRTFFLEAYKIPTSSMETTLLPGDLILVEKLSYGTFNQLDIPLTGWSIPVFTLPDYTKPAVNDVIVFRFPGDRDALIENEDVNYIKRVVGLPGSVLEIIEKKVYVNGEAVTQPEGVIFKSAAGENKSERIFPRGRGWSDKNYGPLQIPQKGDLIRLTPFNFQEWRVFINRELGRETAALEGGKIYIDGKETSEYTVKKNYYFVLGDNRDDSMDSRYWGFVPEENIIGRAFMVYWSLDISALTWLKAVRTDRILKMVH